MNTHRLALAAVLSLAFTAATASGPRADGEVLRADLARQIVARWSSHVDQHYPITAGDWAVEMAPAFADASLEELQAAAAADTFNDMSRLLLGQEARDATNALGDAAADLVFVPVTPCRLFDTRLAGGPISAGGVRIFDITTAAGYAGQGGDNSDCGVGSDGSFAAAVINLTVVSPSGAGFITAYPLGAPQPLAASLNYAAGAVVGNEVIVKLDQGVSAGELSVYTFAQTHLVGDIVGYFATPRATALQCQEETALTAIPAGTNGAATTPACPVGHTITGGGCSSSSFDGRVVTTRTLFDRHFCSFRNEGASTMNGVAYSLCCRVPGR